jgi:hypothetical protein
MRRNVSPVPATSVPTTSSATSAPSRGGRTQGPPAPSRRRGRSRCRDIPARRRRPRPTTGAAVSGPDPPIPGGTGRKAEQRQADQSTTTYWRRASRARAVARSTGG